MRRFAVVLPALLSACAAHAPATPTSERLPEQQVMQVLYPGGGSYEITITRQDYVTRAQLHGSRMEVWNALPDAYTELGLPLPLLDRGRWTAAVQEHRTSQRLGNERLSSYFDCGVNNTGRNADTRRIVMSVYTSLQSIDATTTAVEVKIDALAHTNEGATVAPLPCTSRGVLERRLAAALQLRTVGGDTR